MADFSYTGSGGLEIFGCAGPNTSTFYVVTLFNTGDLVWLRHSARRGILEKVFIKQINFITNVQYNYQDNFNRLWLENELCDFTTAEQLVAIYAARSRAAYILAQKNCNAVID
jgi:hypothetical protein